MLDKWSSIIGTKAKAFHLGFKNLILDASSGILKITDKNGALVRAQAAAPTDSNDVVTKGYMDIHTDHYDVFKAGRAITGGRAVCMTSSGLTYLTADNIEAFIGVAKQSVASGANCAVSLGPIVGGFSNIVVGQVYYLGTDGTITTTAGNCTGGVGVSTSEIKLNVRRVDGVYFADVTA